MNLKHHIKLLFRGIGLDIRQSNSFPPGLTPLEIQSIKKCEKFSMTTREQLKILFDAVKYLEENKIQGDLVECGVWKGGSALAIAIAIEGSIQKRNIYLYDTFAGMTAPTQFDRKIGGGYAKELLNESQENRESKVWAIASLEEVKRNILGNTTLSESHFQFIVGDVAETLQAKIPSSIALARLDTDWYESTKIELELIWPKIVPGGILIIDDYGHWEGAKLATDEFFERLGFKPFLFPYGSARVMVKS